MITLMWLLVVATAAACAGMVWHSVRKWRERERVEERRAAEFVAQMTRAAARKDAAPATPASAPAEAAAPAPAASAGDLAQQRLLFDAAHKAGEAGEPALSIQLYARLLVRYPASGFAAQVRAAAAAQKKKLAKG